MNREISFYIQMNIYDIIIASFDGQETRIHTLLLVIMAIFGTNCFKTMANFHLCMQ